MPATYIFSLEGQSCLSIASASCCSSASSVLTSCSERERGGLGTRAVPGYPFAQHLLLPVQGSLSFPGRACPCSGEAETHQSGSARLLGPANQKEPAALLLVAVPFRLTQRLHRLVQSVTFPPTTPTQPKERAPEPERAAAG